MYSQYALAPAACQEPSTTYDASMTGVLAVEFSDAEFDSPVEIDLIPEGLMRLSDVPIERVRWLGESGTFEHGRLPLQKVTLLAGDPGIGKTHVALDIAARQTSLGHSVLFLTAEDGLGDTLRPRLEDLGGNSHNLLAFEGNLNLNTQRDLARLKAYVRYAKPKFIVLDPFQGFVGSRVDIHRANQTRPIFTSLKEIATEYDAALLILAHLNKDARGRNPLYRILGSIDITAAVRSVIVVGCDPKDRENRAAFHAKVNNGPEQPAAGYSLVGGSFKWTGLSELTQSKVFSDAIDDGGKKAKITAAKAFLYGVLSQGPKPQQEVEDLIDHCEAVPITSITLQRAKRELGVESYRVGEEGKIGGGTWYWRLLSAPSL